MKTSRKSLTLFAAGLAGGVFFSEPAGFAAVFVQIGQNFTASTYGVDSDSQPADANGAIGPNHYVEFINGRFSVFDKHTGRRMQTMADDTFWSKAGVTLTLNLGVTDPRIVFDAATQRWFAAMVDFDLNTNASNRFLVAVSTTANPTNAWRALAFAVDPTSSNFADFPTLGVDANGIYLGGDVFDVAGNSLGPMLVAIPKSGLLTSPPSIAGRTNFGLMNYTNRGFILQPAVTQGTASSGASVLSVGDLGGDFQPHATLLLSTIDNAGVVGAATLSDATTLTVPDYNVPINPPQPDGSSNLDNGDTRFSATVYRVNDTLYAVHSTEIDNRAALQWFQINATNLTVEENGAITDPVLDLYYPSIAANAAGTVVIGFNGSSTNTFVSSYAVVGEPVNGVLTFGSLLRLKTGTASYQNPDPTDGTSRWGDYSATSVDPLDPNRFWTIQTIATGPSTWSTQVTELITGEVTVSAAVQGTNLVLSWSGAAEGYQVQSAADLASTNAWTTVAQTPVATNNLFTVSVPLSDNQGFYRVIKPL